MFNEESSDRKAEVPAHILAAIGSESVYLTRHPYELPVDAGDESQIAAADIALQTLGISVDITNLPINTTDQAPEGPRLHV